jgi:hypothetical protein
MTMESGFPFTFNFATLNLDKNQSLYFVVDEGMDLL